MKIALIGTGKVATHLTKRLKELSLDLSGVLGSSHSKTQDFSEIHKIPALHSFSDLAAFDFCFVCVQDSQLETVLRSSLNYCNAATLSGTFDIQQFNNCRFHAGVFYPLQSFSKDAVIQFEKIPIFIESNHEELKNQLLGLAHKVGKEGIEMTVKQRVHLHLTAVFLNNFTHHVSALGNAYAKEHNIEYHWFEALIEETFRKIIAGASFNDQTGPAQRNDQTTMEKHLELLDELKARVYKSLSESIQNNVSKP